MFEEFDESALNDPDFKEDSVRELVIAPILGRLGYGPSGTTRVVRSKSLKHPFIRVGTRKHPVTTIPDYTIYVEGRPGLVLDAKSPEQSVWDCDHIQQAYSYAVHPEIRCREFGLCNGRELLVFSTDQVEPLLEVAFGEFDTRWEEIERILSPKYIQRPELRHFMPDLGFALNRIGFGADTDLTMLGTRLNLFGRVHDDLMTASANCDLGWGEHCVSFDFSPRLLPEIVAGLPEPLGERFCDALKRAPYQAAAGLVIELDITARLGETIQGQWEEFVPLVIREVHDSRFNPEEIEDDPDDIPPHVFKLRDAFVISNGGSNA